MSMKTLFVVLGLVALSTGVGYPWSTPQRISPDNSGGLYAKPFNVTPTSEAAQKAGKDSVVALYNWPHATEGWWHIDETFSANGGSSWGNQQVMFGEGVYGNNYSPSLLGRGSYLHATWVRDSSYSEDEYFIDICYARSTNYGQTWSNPYTASPPTHWRDKIHLPLTDFPHLAATSHNNSNDTMMIVFRNPNSSPANEPYFIVSTDAGVNWSTPTYVYQDSARLTNVTYGNGRFIVVYSKLPSPTSIYSIYTTNGGSTWTGRTQIPPSSSSNPADYPVIAAVNSYVLCVWRDSTTGHLYSDTSTGGASHWNSKRQQVETNKPANDPSMATWPSLTYNTATLTFPCVWASQPSSAQSDIYLSEYSSTWSSPSNLTNAASPFNYYGPRVSCYTNSLGGWTDFVTCARDSASFGYYQIWETQRNSYPQLKGGPQSQGAVERGVGSGPMLRAYPNPAGGAVRISCSLGEGHERGALKVYTVTGNLVKTFPVSGTNGLNWDLKDEQGKPVANGVYLLRLEGAGVPISEKVVVMR